MLFELTILGSNAAIPAMNRFPSAQVLNVQDRLYLIDCGEGTQVRLMENHIRRSRINQVFISHLHGDHYYGLIGLMTTMNLMGRENSLDIFAPKGMQSVIEVQLNVSGTKLDFPIHFHEVDTEKHQMIFKDEVVKVYSIPLQHRIPTSGYLFMEQDRLRNIRSELLPQYDLSVDQMNALKRGEDVKLKDGTLVPNEQLTLPPYRPRSFAYCSDTLYHKAIIQIIKNVDILFHEATFGNDHIDQALQTFHSTAIQAANIAQKAEVNKLIIGHFSSRYKDLTVLLDEARSVFPFTELAIEKKRFSVPLSR